MGTLWDAVYRREAAVAAVDAIYGHTAEFAPDPQAHIAEYGEAEIALDRRYCPACGGALSYDDGAYYCDGDGTMGEDKCVLALRRYPCP